MNLLRSISLSIVLGAASGCSLVAPLVEKQVAPIALPDAQNALAMAQAAGDTDAAACYADLVNHLQNDPAGASLPKINGALSALEAARVAAAHSGDPIVPADVHRDCAVLLIDAQEMAAKLGLAAPFVKAAPVILNPPKLPKP